MAVRWKSGCSESNWSRWEKSPRRNAMPCGEGQAVSCHSTPLFTRHVATFEGKQTEALCSPSAGVSQSHPGVLQLQEPCKCHPHRAQRAPRVATLACAVQGWQLLLAPAAPVFQLVGILQIPTRFMKWEWGLLALVISSTLTLAFQ